MRKFGLAATLIVATLFVFGCEKKGTQVTSIEPAFGNIAGDDNVVILGSGFKEGLVVQFGKSQVSQVVIESPTRMRVRTPSGAAGKTDVIVIGEDGQTYVLEKAFTYRSGQ